ncbi:NAD(+) diphosphatase [Marinimicrobium alkaliphilum]|uniref:NAD(+) diphosphatase n=1 Tax=Marinimicrobium alkaliphilum TaxID=2202654 RepID=UPI000DBA7C88|nr:NAD(+) diphosphatase [Marinimicrobium alkaliphilum]
MSRFIAASLPPSSRVDARYLLVAEGLLCCPEQGLWAPVPEAQLTVPPAAVTDEHFVGYLDGAPCWVWVLNEALALSGYQWLGLRTQLGVLDDPCFSLAGRALQLAQWQRDHRYCGRCGRPTRSLADERAKVCDACEQRYYPRLSPCMITLVTRGDECLLALHARARQRPMYTALAGFIEAGEAVEDTVRREVMEEVGLKVHRLRYFGSQSWPFPGQLMLGFHADYRSGEICVDGEEIVDARWWRFDQLPDVPPVTTLSGQLIRDFVERCNAAV